MNELHECIRKNRRLEEEIRELRGVKSTVALDDVNSMFSNMNIAYKPPVWQPSVEAKRIFTLTFNSKGLEPWENKSNPKVLESILSPMEYRSFVTDYDYYHEQHLSPHLETFVYIHGVNRRISSIRYRINLVDNTVWDEMNMVGKIDVTTNLPQSSFDVSDNMFSNMTMKYHQYKGKKQSRKRKSKHRKSKYPYIIRKRSSRY